MKHIQSFYESLGKYGCYFLLIVNIAERYTGEKIDIIETVLHAQKKGWLYYNLDNHKDKNNFYVVNPGELLSWLTKKKFTVVKENGDYQPKKNEYEILFYATSISNAEKGIGHFAMKNYDTIQNANTVKNGKVFSKRIFREVL